MFIDAKLFHVFLDSREQCEMRYGFTPKVRINGHTGANFPYIMQPLDYMLPELIKNSLR